MPRKMLFMFRRGRIVRKKNKITHQNRPNPNIQCTNTKEKKEKNFFFFKGPNFTEAYSLKSGFQKLVQLFLPNFRTQKLWEFFTTAKGRALKKLQDFN